MNSISTDNRQTSNVVQQKSTSVHEQKPANTAEQSANKNGLKLADDIVNLSSSSKNPATPKKPSVQVTSAEKKALLNKFR